MATAKGTWTLSSDESKPNRKHRNHNYTFNIEHKGLEVNGFILHTDKHKRDKFRVYYNANENGRFDKHDQLIGRSGLKQKYASKGVGNLLDEGEIGQLEVKFKTSKLNASIRESDDTDAQSIGARGDTVGSVINSMSFATHRNADNDIRDEISVEIEIISPFLNSSFD